MRVHITVTDERFGTETEHELVAEVYCHKGEKPTWDCPGEEPWNEIINLWVDGDPQRDDNCIWGDLNDLDCMTVQDAVEKELSNMEPY